MANQASDHPTRVETQILRVLWERGEATLRDVCDDLSRERRVTPSGISTILKIMVDKGLARVTDQRRPQKFAAAISRVETGGNVVGDVLSRFFGGSVLELVRAALGSDKGKLTSTDYDCILRMLAEHHPARKNASRNPAE